MLLSVVSGADIVCAWGAASFVDATPEPITGIDQARGRLSLTIKVDEQRQYRVGRFEVLGLDQELESQLKAILKPGEIYNSTLVYDFFSESTRRFCQMMSGPNR
jgi:outer membrane protein assembly factor BamA